MEKETYGCFICGKRHTLDKMHNVNNFKYCNSCYKERVIKCSICGIEIDKYINGHYEENGKIGCYKCCGIEGYHQNKNKNIVFYGDTENNSKAYIGFELEIEKEHETEHNYTAGIVKSLIGGDFIHNEYDGSIDNGFEIITQPATLDYHLSIKDRYEKALEYLKKEYISHDTDCCGLHVHINKSFFEDEEDLCTIKLLYLTEKYWDNLVKFSRRTLYQLNRWANRYTKTPEEIVKHKENYGRYFAVNLTNENTIEFRLFRGTLKLNTLIATLQLVNNLVVLSKETKTTKEIREITWEQIINTKELKQYWEEVKNRKVE